MRDAPKIRVALLAKWKAFDDSCARGAGGPGDRSTGPNPQKAETFETVCREYAQVVGLEVSVFRALLVDWRRAGRDREQALAAVERGAQTS